LGIGIGERTLWGQGYGFEASQLALEFAFHELNLHRVQVTVFSYNKRSQALFEKLGFRQEGVFREFLERDGQRHDMFLYGLLRQEWQAQRDIHRSNLP
jgi:RimJ/RimL family protein N-acetyltransferase